MILKEAFFNYLGATDSLVGYQRSYKLVFYKVFFARLFANQETSCDSISSDFRQYYIQRKNAGLVPDIKADDVIKNIERSTLRQVLKLIIRNPFGAISSHGFIVKESGEKERFVLNPELSSQLSSDDIEKIIHIVDQKLDKYYFNIDSIASKDESTRVTMDDRKKHEHKTWLISWNPRSWNWKDYLDAVLITRNGNTYIRRWSCVNTHVMPGDRVFLTVLGIGAKNGIIASGIAIRKSFEDDHWNPEKQVQGIKIKMIEVSFDSILDYSNQKFLKQSLLTAMFPEQQWSPQGSGIEIKAKYVKQLEAEWEKIKRQNTNVGGEEELTVKETIGRIKDFIASKGFSYQDGLIENFFLSLKSKPFVILAGTSGTGKTRLVKLFAEAIGATISNGHYKMVSVRPDWSDSSDLFGHVDLNGRFIPGAIIDFIKRAELDSTHPYFLCLDEMNLARVEYYLSDFLSAMETRDFQEGHIVSEPLVSSQYYGADSSAAGKYGTVLLPENLYVIGTVNMDETTFPFSRKVLDRANTIEFSFVDLTPPAEWSFNTPAPLSLENSFLKAEYLLLVQCADQQEAVNTYCAELQKLNRILKQANAHVGYRVRDEIVFYLLSNKTANLLPENEAMDNEIMQKILPRIQGSSAAIKNMLCDFFKVCAGDYEGQNTESDLSSKMMKVAEKSDCKYPKSAQKIAFMVRRFEEDGFTSYWL